MSRKRPTDCSPDARRRSFAAPAVFAFGLALTGVAFFALRDEERGRASAEFQERVAGCVAEMARRADFEMAALRSIGLLFAASERVTAADFAIFARDCLLHDPCIAELAWAEIGDVGGAGASFGSLKARHVVAQDGTPTPEGFEFASSAAATGAILLAVRSGGPRSSLEPRARAADPCPPLRVFVPVVDASKAPESAPVPALKGFLVARVDLEGLARATLAHDAARMAGIELSLLALQPGGRPALPHVDRRVTANVYNRRMQIAAAMGPEFEARHRRMLPWLVALAGAILSAVIAALVSTLTRSVRELTLARDRAAAADQAKSQFLNNVSHELRTPMNGVVGITEILATTRLDAEQRDLVETVRGCSGALIAVLDDVLDFASAAEGRLGVSLEVVDVRRALEDAVLLLAPQAGRKGLALSLLVDAGVPELMHSDEARLRQVLLHLIGNAIKFTESGEVHVRAERCNGDRLAVRVVDSGPGVAPELEDRLFLPFVQGDGSLTREKNGLGLGLALVRELTTQLGGDIAHANNPEGGSTFRLELPVDGAAAPPEQPALVASVRPKVLVADPHPLRGATLALLLERCGVDAMHSSGSAAASLAERPPALLFCASDAPDCDALLDQARRLAIPAIVVHPPGRRADDAWPGRLAFPCREPVLTEAVSLALAAAHDESEADESCSGEHVSIVVLVVEDNPVNQRITRRQLERAGHAVDVAENGLLALEAIDHRAYDLVLMDCQMPVLDGLEATRRIRARESGARHLPVVALTAHSSLEDRERCATAGMDDFLTKPTSATVLVETVERWTKRRARGRRR